MKFSRAARWLLLALVCLAGLPAPAAPKKAQDLGDPPGYVKRATWPETMVASRAESARLLAQAEQRARSARFTPFVSESLRGEGPGVAVSVDVAGLEQVRLVTVVEEGAGNCHIWGEARLIAKDGSVTRLCDLKPIAIRVGWGELLTNKNWQNSPLRVASREFKHGVWVHGDSDVCYALGGKYERLEAWAGLDKDRATGAARFKVLAGGTDPVPAVWQKIKRDYPAQTEWMEKDAGPGRQIDWFYRAEDSRHDQGLIGRALGQAGAAGQDLRKDLDELRRAKAPADDPRWLDLYGRACRARQSAAPLGKIWIADLRRGLEEELQALARTKTAADDPRWAAIESKAARCAELLGPAPPCTAEGLRPSIEELAKALPSRFQGASDLLKRLDEHERRWGVVVTGIVKGDEAAMKQAAAMHRELADLRRAVLAGMRGMKEFLAMPAHAAADKEWEVQFESLRSDLANRAQFDRVAKETFRQEALILATDRDPVDVVLRRTAALLADLKRQSVPGLEGLEKDLAELQAAGAAVKLEHADARFAIFADACRVRRQIAFKNPVLGFDQIVFIKRHRALYDHMCDQYYGMAARPGGGLYVLSGAFGPNPQLRDVLAGAVVQRGRLKGEKLSGGPNNPPPFVFDGGGNLHGPDHDGGSFLSPDLSFDGKAVLFAYVECRGDKRHRHHTDPTQGHWYEGRCYHIFRVNIDGTGLEQLTDGTWNDFDPCWLPNGRIAFMSERRGGYLRCGRVCPTYTLCDMAADGSDIACLSFHETNEWHPSVTHDGRIVYTRWDYVDRHGCTAHLPWITTLDGRDSRAVHGNFTPRPMRPDMELNCRAVPGSQKFTATAAPHHGQAYGSLVMIDPRVEDDDGMAPVRRITPEVGFPESQGGAQVYGTAWPLSEDYYLCVYDAMMKPGAGFQGGQYQPGNYGIYLVDSFGNRELIYRDPEIACLSPVPLVPRPMPPVVPEFAKRGPDTNPVTRGVEPVKDKRPEGTVAVMNVYDGLKPWPAGTKIKELRVLQVLPMSVPSGGPPHETGLRVATAGDSVVPTRFVLGTVPVEADGSAHFVVPANKEMFFQALDERGLAVQSMRSATYLHEGERLTCQGCHDRRHRVPEPPKTLTLALRREPSRLRPDVDGSNPFSYPRLVQPVLDKHCVQCHAEKADKAPNLAREPITRKWYASYVSLVPEYGFYDYGDAYRTTPGRFGARASKLLEILEKGHYEVKLSPEELHRITLWLDCSSLFYGVYEKEGGEAQLRGEVAMPTLE